MPSKKVSVGKRELMQTANAVEDLAIEEGVVGLAATGEGINKIAGSERRRRHRSWRHGCGRERRDSRRRRDRGGGGAEQDQQRRGRGRRRRCGRRRRS